MRIVWTIKLKSKSEKSWERSAIGQIAIKYKKYYSAEVPWLYRQKFEHCTIKIYPRLRSISFSLIHPPVKQNRRFVSVRCNKDIFQGSNYFADCSRLIPQKLGKFTRSWYAIWKQSVVNEASLQPLKRHKMWKQGSQGARAMLKSRKAGLKWNNFFAPNKAKAIGAWKFRSNLWKLEGDGTIISDFHRPGRQRWVIAYKHTALNKL